MRTLALLMIPVILVAAVPGVWAQTESEYAEREAASKGLEDFQGGASPEDGCAECCHAIVWGVFFVFYAVGYAFYWVGSRIADLFRHEMEVVVVHEER